MRLYGEITKLEPQDDGTLKVLGVASSGALDQAEERVSPTAMKAALPDYMRFGALREMHGLSAAGATLSADVDPDGVTRIEAHVVDPVAVKKVRLGVYKGFSIGGQVLERDPADRRVITALRLDEISLVDRPCNPEAVIQMWKAAARPDHPAPTNAQVIAKAIELAAAAGKRGRLTEYVVKAREALMHQTHQSGPAQADPSVEVTAKIGARNSQDDLARIQAAHDELVALGAQCGGGAGAGVDTCATDPDGDGPDPDADGDIDKAFAIPGPQAPRSIGADPALESLRRTVEQLKVRVEALGAQARPPRAAAGWARPISKVEDGDPSAVTPEALAKYIEALSPEDRGQLELRAALSRPIPLHGR
ncbi:MAG: HK97 family phage prohead protease [Caulobacteraceae bacterium]|nr:HK97 family phage prohead protease [Caulobacteraceae bacterium]